MYCFLFRLSQVALKIFSVLEQADDIDDDTIRKLENQLEAAMRVTSNQLEAAVRLFSLILQ